MAESDMIEEIKPEKNQDKINQEEMLSILAEVIRALHQKCINGRFKNPESEKIRDAKLRILVSAIGVAENLIQDQHVEALEMRIAALEVSLQKKGGKNEKYQ